MQPQEISPAIATWWSVTPASSCRFSRGARAPRVLRARDATASTPAVLSASGGRNRDTLRGALPANGGRRDPRDRPSCGNRGDPDRTPGDRGRGRGRHDPEPSRAPLPPAGRWPLARLQPRTTAWRLQDSLFDSSLPPVPI